MCPIVGSDRPEARIPGPMVVEELVGAVPVRTRGRLPMRSALVQPTEAEYTPSLKDRYWSR